MSLTGPDSRGRDAPDAGRPLLTVEDLRVHFALHGGVMQRLFGRSTAWVRAVDGVNVEVRRGEVLGIVGESGSGKTTLGRAILGSVPITSGRVVVGSTDIAALRGAELRAMRRRVQMVFQDPNASLNPAMDMLAAVGHPLRIHGVGHDDHDVRERVCAALERVGLTPAERYLHAFPSDLSGGQKQRAVIARAVILGPELLVADEPVSMLDMSVRAKILELMLDLKRELSLTYVYITHDLATAKFFCDSVAIMYLGRIVEYGPADEIYADPKHPYTRALLRAVPDPDPNRSAPRDLPRGEVPDAAARPLGCAFHPRCPDAFEICGWESRDVRDALERHWARREDDYERERRVVGDLSILDHATLVADVPAGPGHDGDDVRRLLDRVREETPDDPLWSGVHEMREAARTARIEFRDDIVDPPLYRVSSPGRPDVDVACLLYRSGKDGGVPPARG